MTTSASPSPATVRHVMSECRECRDPFGRLDGHAVGSPESKTDEGDAGHAQG